MTPTWKTLVQALILQFPRLSADDAEKLAKVCRFLDRAAVSHACALTEQRPEERKLHEWHREEWLAQLRDILR